MNVADRYTYRVTWSPEDDSYVATVAELPSLSWLDDDQREALNGIVQLVRDVVSDLENEGEPVPVPLAERVFSGKFMVRIPPEVHRELAVEAAEQRVSLNRLITSRLSAQRSDAVIDQSTRSQGRVATAHRIKPSPSPSASSTDLATKRKAAKKVVAKKTSSRKAATR